MIKQVSCACCSLAHHWLLRLVIEIENRQAELERRPVEVELDFDVESSIEILIVSCSLHSDSAMNTEEVVTLGSSMSCHWAFSRSHPSFLHGLSDTRIHLTNEHIEDHLPIQSSPRSSSSGDKRIPMIKSNGMRMPAVQALAKPERERG